MLSISHRGYCKVAPENTLEAFQQAVELGIDGIETDIRLSHDRKLVLFHDRLILGRHRVASLTRGELSQAVGYPVPTLEEALQAWDNILWVLEIKTPDTAETVVTTLAPFLHIRRFLLISFWHQLIQKICEQLSIECGLSLGHRPIDLPNPNQLVQWHHGPRTLVWDYEFMDAEILKQASELGWQNLVYGPASQEEHQDCWALGLDGVITDHPHYLSNPEH